MTELEISMVRGILLEWGSKHFQQYPWREVDNPWLGLLAEILLQRTKAVHVEENWERMVEKYPDPESVLKLDPNDLLAVDRAFGLDRRGRTIYELAQYLDMYDYYPDSYDELVRLYGIGHYTASAYLSLHLNVRAVILDSNIARWLSRLTGLALPKDLRKSSEIWDIAEQLTPPRDFKNYNYAILDFTMGVCLPRKPVCMSCPLGHKGLCYHFRAVSSF